MKCGMQIADFGIVRGPRYGQEKLADELLAQALAGDAQPREYRHELYRRRAALLIGLRNGQELNWTMLSESETAYRSVRRPHDARRAATHRDSLGLPVPVL